MKYFILFLSLLIIPIAHANEIEFGDWYGIYDNAGNKNIVAYSGSNEFSLTIYIDDQDIHRLKFDPPIEVSLATFNHKRFNSMNFQSLYGYEHWIKRMIKYYNLQVWFVGDETYEVFSLKGFTKAEKWLNKGD
jgi:hypothetical protein